MTRFNPNKIQKTSEEWSALAFKKTSENSIQWNVIGGLTIAAVVGSATSIATGGLVAAYFLYDSIKKARGIQRNQTAIRDLGCVAHVLDGDDFLDYQRQVGHDAVMEELTFASDRNYPISDDALDYFEDNFVPPPPLLPPATEKESASFTLNSDIPLKQRAIAVIDALIQSGFKIDEIMSSQVIAIAGTQRGGKGTLAAILATLSKALDPNLEILYFTAGVDIYPFNCTLHCALKYPNIPSDVADERVAQNLLHYLKGLDGCEPYSHKNLILVIDEAMKLLGHLEEQDRIWAIQFLLCRFGKTGATLIIVLHASNLSSIVGSKNTEGLAATFKQSVSFIGCVAQPVNAGGLRKINVASGAYFKANPDNFGSAISGGELGSIPDWLKTEKHPGNGHPDPARTLLKIFPELETTSPTKIERLEQLFSVEASEHEIKDYRKSGGVKEQASTLENDLTEHEQMLLSWIKTRKTTGKEYDLNTANKNLDKLLKPDDYDTKVEYLRHLARQLKSKKKGTLVNPNQFEPN